MVGNGMGAKNGILFKTAVSLEETGRVQIVALDKTGTITNGTPKVTDVIPTEAYNEDGIVQKAIRKLRELDDELYIIAKNNEMYKLLKSLKLTSNQFVSN